MTVAGVRELRELFSAWSSEAERLMAENRSADATTPHGLTLTFGMGLSLFEANGRDRSDLRRARPAALAALPAFPHDAIDQSISGGDLCIQACAAAPQAATDALRRLAELAGRAAGIRWSQEGFLRADPRRAPGPPRDVLGFKAGTNNIRRGRERDRHVWVGRRERRWMMGGTYLVVRRIQVRLGDWSRLGYSRQERVIGRHKLSGAPIGGRREFDPLPLEAVADGQPVVPLDAHSRVASPRSNGGVSMLRRSYNYNNGLARDGERDAGLLFMAYVEEPRRQFVPVQRRLADGDALTPFTRHVGSAVFAIPPGARPGGFIAEGLFEEVLG